jgi:hypothetical protein
MQATLVVSHRLEVEEPMNGIPVDPLNGIYDRLQWRSTQAIYNAENIYSNLIRKNQMLSTW